MFIPILQFSGDFTLTYAAQCARKANKLTTLNEAIQTCSSNTGCVGVFDDRCDNEGDFQMCLDALVLNESSISHEQNCVYKKTNHYGKYLNLGRQYWDNPM